ncbi:MAG: M48 family metalloprotease [Burkholderiaceae bacterium]|nr:M48 family metalloprotease [Burkholderiaceae bacterium]
MRLPLKVCGFIVRALHMAMLADGFSRRLRRNRLTRRDVLSLFGAATGAAAAAALGGCAVSPVTGDRILVGMSEDQERAIDRQVAPHQFSQDLGPVQDAEINRYVAGVGSRLHALSHRPAMPYSYRVLNANYVNAYTFPGGAMGLTRGIMAELDDEAQLAALLGHEIGHVNARHAAQRQGQAMLAQAAVVGLGVASSDSPWGGLLTVAGQIGASALLASYSRDNEREADALGQQYMVKGGYPADGMTRLHALLVREEKAKPSLLATMFASHPMSRERMETAQRLAQTQYAASLKSDAGRERYMDNTARLRQLKPAIDACKNGEMALAAKRLSDAEQQFGAALKHAPQDYASNVLMARCLAAQGKRTEALRFAETARQIYPQEGQAHKLVGVLHLQGRDPAQALAAFDQFDRLLPGDPGIAFLKGVSFDAMGDRPRAAAHYRAFLQSGGQGPSAQFAANRLQALGALR